jgi:hypothetical protein
LEQGEGEGEGEGEGGSPEHVNPFLGAAGFPGDPLTNPLLNPNFLASGSGLPPAGTPGTPDTNPFLNSNYLGSYSRHGVPGSAPGQGMPMPAYPGYPYMGTTNPFGYPAPRYFQNWQSCFLKIILVTLLR